MRNIDLHCHPSQKTSFTTTTTEDYIEFQTNVTAFGIPDEWKVVGDILDSQCSVSQLDEGQFGLVFWAIISFERKFLDDPKLRDALNNLVIPELDYEFFETLQRGAKSYFEVLKREWKIMTDLVEAGNGRLAQLQSIDELGDDTINVFPCVEGFHSFIDHKDDDAEIADENVLINFNQFIKTRKIAYVTLSHLVHFDIFNHCNATKLLSEKKQLSYGWVPYFISERGYNDLGEKLIDRCIAEGIGIDLKHTSYVARFHILKKLKAENRKYRLLASHCGVVGRTLQQQLRSLSRDEEKRDKRFFQIKKEADVWVQLDYQNSMSNAEFSHGAKSTTFNPITLNLLDDEIRMIFELGGLIGVSMDQRVLGYGVRNIKKVEFVTVQDFAWLCFQTQTDPTTYIGRPYPSTWNFADWSAFKDTWKAYREQLPNSRTQYYKRKPKVKNLVINRVKKDLPVRRQRRYRAVAKTKHLTNTIMHLLKVAKENGLQSAWQQIAIGSDFDGLVDAIDGCLDSSKFPELSKLLKSQIEEIDNRTSILDFFNIDTDTLLKAVFEKNAIQFFKK